jgi:hypothetical protein
MALYTSCIALYKPCVGVMNMSEGVMNISRRQVKKMWTDQQGAHGTPGSHRATPTKRPPASSAAAAGADAAGSPKGSKMQDADEVCVCVCELYLIQWESYVTR